jgi:hypothetical protein
MIEYFDKFITSDAKMKYETYIKMTESKISDNPLTKKPIDIKDNLFEEDILDLTYRLQKHVCKIGNCKKIYNGLVQNCKLNMPKELTNDTRIEYSQKKLKNGNLGPWECSVIAKRLNNEYIIDFNQEILHIWRGNGNFSLCFEYYKIFLYILKYTTKPETKSNTFKEIFNQIFECASDSTDTKSSLKKLMMKVLGERDVTPNEAIHTLLGLNLHSSNVTVIKSSLANSNQILSNKRKNKLKISDIQLYAKRLTIDKSLKNLNFVSFLIKFDCAKSSLENLCIRNNPERYVLRLQNYYCLTENSPEYWLYCQQELLMYKPWSEDRLNVLEKNMKNDENGN